ncbi:alpha-ribazole phosphatase [Spirochaetia bacterium]|nr:alpha-ribazole phosphatase [Spirochaetia bacterium]
MAVKLYILRHGLPLFPDSVKRYIARTDLPLSPEGIAQAEQTAFRLANTGIGVVYTSPLRRCRDFAEIIVDKLGLPTVIAIPELMEINMGSWEYRSIQEIKNTCPDEYTARGLNMAGFTPEGGESFLRCQIRAVKAITAIAAKGRDSRMPEVCIVTHAGLIRSFLCYAEDHDLNDLFYYKIPYGGIFTVNYEDGRFKPALSLAPAP